MTLIGFSVPASVIGREPSGGVQRHVGRLQLDHVDPQAASPAGRDRAGLTAGEGVDAAVVWLVDRQASLVG